MDKVLKRRLVGATILIALAVIFLPMLLVDPDGMPSGGELAEMPPMPESARDVRRIPLNPESARAPAGGSDERNERRDPEPPELALPGDRDTPSEPPESRPEIDDEIVLRPELTEDAPEQDQNGSEPVAAADDEQPSGPAPVARPVLERPDPEEIPDDVTMGDWVVQVASFGSPDSASEVRQRLERLGHIVMQDEIARGDGTLYRLRTGPYLSRPAAEQALQQISTTVRGVQPIVVKLDEPVPAPSDGAPEGTGFAVQVGSFIGENNAVAETRRLQQLGFEAFRFSEVVGERQIWRVRVGPVGDRAAAEALLRRVDEQAEVEGLVVSHP